MLAPFLTEGYEGSTSTTRTTSPAQSSWSPSGAPGFPPSSASRILPRREAAAGRAALVRPTVTTLPTVVLPLTSLARTRVVLGDGGCRPGRDRRRLARAARGRRRHWSALAGTEQLGRCLAALDLLPASSRRRSGPTRPPVRARPGRTPGQGCRRPPAAVLSILSGLGVAAAVARHGSSSAGSASPNGGGVSSWRRSGPVSRTAAPRGARCSRRPVDAPRCGGAPPAHPVLLGLAAFGASLTKETSYPSSSRWGSSRCSSRAAARGRPSGVTCSSAERCRAGARAELGLQPAPVRDAAERVLPRSRVADGDPGVGSSSSRRDSSSRRTAASSSSGRLRPSSSRSSWQSPVVQAVRRVTSWRAAWPSFALARARHGPSSSDSPSGGLRSGGGRGGRASACRGCSRILLLVARRFRLHADALHSVACIVLAPLPG